MYAWNITAGGEDGSWDQIVSKVAVRSPGQRNIYMPMQKKMLILGQDNRHKESGNEKARGPVVVWECVFSVSWEKYFHAFGVAWLKEMELKPVAHWVKESWEDGQGRIAKSFET